MERVGPPGVGLGVPAVRHFDADLICKAIKCDKSVPTEGFLILLDQNEG